MKIAVNNFSKLCIAQRRQVATFKLLWICAALCGREKKCAIRKKSFDDSARVAKVIPVLSQVAPVTNEKRVKKVLTDSCEAATLFAVKNK